MLVNARTLVGTLVLGKMILVFLSVCSRNFNPIGSYKSNLTVALSNFTYTGVFGCTVFHAGSDNRGFRTDQRHSLTLHVRAHQCTVSIIVAEERNQSCC